MNRKRLEVEAIRDSLLAISGQLQSRPRASHFALVKTIGGQGNVIDLERFGFDFDRARARTVYAPVVRRDAPTMLDLFDFPDSNNLVGKRDVTTSPTQALYLMNSKFSKSPQFLGSRSNLRSQGGPSMRIPHQEQLQLDVTPISQIDLDTGCRDRMIPILRGLQHIHAQPALRDQALQLISEDVLRGADPDQGRPGLSFWQVFVLSSVRLGANITYDHLHYLAGGDRNLRAMMQVGDWSEADFSWKCINENVRLIRPETIEQINHLVVAEGHRLHPEAVEYVLGDTFVSQTNIHYPTESGLMLDGLSKICDLAPGLASSVGSVGWRQSKSLFKKAKKAHRAISRIKKGGRNYQQRLQAASEGLFHFVDLLLTRLETLLERTLGNLPCELFAYSVSGRPSTAYVRGLLARERTLASVPGTGLLAQRHLPRSRHGLSTRGVGRDRAESREAIQLVRAGHGIDQAGQGRLSD